MNITPLRGIILLTKKEKDYAKTTSGIFLAGESNTKTDTYIVKKVSKDSNFAEGQELVFEGEPIAELPESTVISESQIIAIIE